MISWSDVVALAADGGYAVTLTLDDLEAALVLALVTSANVSVDEADQDGYEAVLASVTGKLSGG